MSWLGVEAKKLYGRDARYKKSAVAIAHDLKLPIRYVGVGEGIDDLIPFSPEDYVNALFEEKW